MKIDIESDNGLISRENGDGGGDLIYEPQQRGPNTSNPTSPSTSCKLAMWKLLLNSFGQTVRGCGNKRPKTVRAQSRVP